MKNEIKKNEARHWADRWQWTVASFDAAGLRRIEVLRGHDVAAEVIASSDRVLLGQLGGDYLVGWLR